MAEVELQPFPRYEIIDPLGEGGVATVYKVRAIADGAVRALKALKSEQADDAGSVRRFEDEFKILRRLRHPSLPAVYDYGKSSDGGRFMVMELVEGRPLDAYYADNKDELWLLIYELTEALAFIHEHQLLHFDLKPDNILVKRTNVFGREMPMAMLIDFGLSYQRQSGAATTMAGTPGYIAPEVIREDETLTRAVDYYALGAILYELVEGRMPFEGSAAEVLQSHLLEPITFKSQKVEYAELYPWIERLMSKGVNERLEAFEDFRRIVSARVGDDVSELQKAYALGYIDSLGFIGKDEVWEELKTWADAVGAAPASPTAALDVEEPGEYKLLEWDGAPASAEAPVSRVLALTGPAGSGKTHMLQALQARLAVNGVAAVNVSEVSLDVETRLLTSVDPKTAMLERFAAVWERLGVDPSGEPTVLVVDGLSELVDEAKEFALFALRKAASELLSSGHSSLFIAIADRDPALADGAAEAGFEPDTIVHMTLGAARKTDLLALMTFFEGRVQGRDQLASALGRALDSVGTLITSIRRAVASEQLAHSAGHWHFVAGDLTVFDTTTSKSYYADLLEALPSDTQSVLRWLSCHPGPLGRDSLSSLADIADSDLESALRVCEPHRVVETADGKSDSLALGSPSIRQAFYETVGEDERERMHRRYVSLLESRTRSGDDEMLAFHFTRLGEYRSALAAFVRALDVAEQDKNLSAIRRITDDAVRTADREPGNFDHARRWFLKRRIHAEAATDNYAGLNRVVTRYMTDGDRPVPVSFAPLYATSLAQSNRPRDAERVITTALNDPHCTSAATIGKLLLQRAAVLNFVGDYATALDVLNSIDIDSLQTEDRVRVYLALTRTYLQVGDKQMSASHMKLCQETAERHGHYQLLLSARGAEAYRLFSAGLYDDVLRILAETIRLSTRMLFYRQRKYAYFLASAVHYERGMYDRALRYLDKALRIATESGMRERVSYRIRYAMIFQNLGRYGDALRHINSVMGQFRETKTVDRLLALLTRFDLLVSIWSERAAEHLPEIERAVSTTAGHHNLAYYYRLMGIYELGRGNAEAAVTWLSQAIEAYDKMGYEDDLVRAMIWSAYAHEAAGRPESTDAAIQSVVGRISQIQVPDIHGELLVARLRLATERGEQAELAKAIQTGSSACEKVSDVNVKTRLYRALFLGAAASGSDDDATRFFNLYYSTMKEMAGNLTGTPYLRDFVSNDDFTMAVRVFKQLQEKSPGRDRD